MSAPNKSFDPVEVSTLAPEYLDQQVSAALVAIENANELDELKAVRLAHAGDRSPLALANREIGALPPAAKAEAGKRDVMDNAGIRLLRLVGLGDVDEMHDSLALAVHPRPRKGEVRPGALLQAQDILVEPDRIGELAGPDIEMVEHAYAHAHAMSLPFS